MAKSVKFTKFQIYTYLFRPVTENQEEIPLEDFLHINVQASLDRKQELMGEVLDNNRTLRFMAGDVEYAHKKYIGRDGVYVFRIANSEHKPARVETDFRVRRQANHPSCLVIIDNRKDRQVIAVERKGNKCPFGKGHLLANILEETLRRALLGYRLTLDVEPKYHTSEFWDVADTSMERQGIGYVKFSFAYPNLPEISDMVGDYMNDIARRTNSEPTMQLDGQNGESVRLSRDDQWLLGAIRACAASGRPIEIKPRGSVPRKIGVRSPVYEEIPNAALSELDQKDMFDTKYNAIVKFLDTIKLVYE